MNKILDTDLDPITAIGTQKNNDMYEESLTKVMQCFLRLEDECNRVIMNSIKSKEQRGSRFVEYRKIDANTFKRMEAALNDLRNEQQKWIIQDNNGTFVPQLSVKN